MGFGRIAEAVAALQGVGIRAERGHPTGVMPCLTEAVAAVCLHKMIPEETTVAVHIYAAATAGGVCCEDAAVKAVAALTEVGARCAMESCGFNSKAGVFSCQVLAVWQEATDCTIRINGEVLQHVTSVTSKRSISLAKVTDPETGEIVEERTDLGWSVTIEELLPMEQMPEEDTKDAFTVYIYRTGGLERYLECQWIEILLEDTPSGLRRVRVARTWQDRKLTDAN